MKTTTHRFARTAMLLILAMITTNMWSQTTLNLSGEGTELNPYLIQNVTDWNNLADYVAEGNTCSGLFFKMTSNIGTETEPITKPLGRQTGKNKTDRKRFLGSFDGNHLILTIALNTADSWWSYNKGYCSPFAYTQDATIKNLHVVGSVMTAGTWASGLVGSTGDNFVGTCTIDNCQVSVEITANYLSSGSSYGNHGGFIGIAEGKATITNSWFDGKFLGKDYKYSAGFIGINKGKGTEVTNCLFNPSEINIVNNNIEGSCEFVHSLNGGTHKLTNVYWVSHFGEPENAQGQRVVVQEPDENNYVYTSVVAADGATYYMITGNKGWLALRTALATDGIDYVLPASIVAGSADEALVVPTGATVTLNMGNNTIDRGLMLDAAQAAGYVIKVEAGGELTINGGTITGGHNTGDGGGIYNAGTLNINGTVIDGNFAEGHGGGIYNEGTLNLNGATITNNLGNMQVKHGVGVYVAENGVFNVKGNVRITNNFYTYINSTTFHEPRNVYLDGSSVVTLVDQLNANASIGMEGAEGFFTSGLDGNGAISNFTCDNSNWGKEIRNGEVWLIASVTYPLDITAYDQASATTNGWYLIASPVAVSPDKVTNMIKNTYDLYRFNQSADSQWENYKAQGSHYHFSIVPGQGYLYANSKNVTLSFTGAPYSVVNEIALKYDENVSDAKMRGLNLVGNPYYADANINKTYYRMNDTRTDIVLGSGSVAAMEGVFVYATADDKTVTFTPAAKGSDRSNSGSVVLDLSDNGNVIDRAIVCFDNGNVMPKFQIFEHSTKLYFAQNGNDYAMINAKAQDEMPVNFKAARNGEYTLSVNLENVEMEYMHLIDNLTGANIDLLATPSYSFNAKTDDYASRFRLVFYANNNVNENTHESFAFFNDGNIIITGAGTLQVIDMMGRQLLSREVNSDFRLLSSDFLAQGVYVLRLINGSDVKTQRVVVK